MSAKQTRNCREKECPKLRAFNTATGEALEYAELELNLYHGCPHGCKYCYVPSHRRTDKASFKVERSEVKKASLTNIEHDLPLISGRVHLCFLCDPYPTGMDSTKTREVLDLFRKHDKNFQILTKAGTLAARDFDLYKPGDRFGVTLTFENDVDSRKWEPRAALPSDRIEALRLAKDIGIETWVSLEPVIDPDQTLHLIELTHEYVDFYGVGKLNHDLERENTISWRKYLADAEAFLKKYDKAYKIKAALAKAAQREAV